MGLISYTCSYTCSATGVATAFWIANLAGCLDALIVETFCRI